MRQLTCILCFLILLFCNTVTIAGKLRDNLLTVVSVTHATDKDGGRHQFGTAFVIRVGEKRYIVTCLHVLYNKSILGKSDEVLPYETTKKIKKGELTNVQNDILFINQDGILFSFVGDNLRFKLIPEHDIAIIEVPDNLNEDWNRNKKHVLGFPYPFGSKIVDTLYVIPPSSITKPLDRERIPPYINFYLSSYLSSIHNDAVDVPDSYLVGDGLGYDTQYREDPSFGTDTKVAVSLLKNIEGGLEAVWSLNDVKFATIIPKNQNLFYGFFRQNRNDGIQLHGIKTIGGNSGGALLNRDNEVIGMVVGRNKYSQGLISIAIHATQVIKEIKDDDNWISRKDGLVKNIQDTVFALEPVKGPPAMSKEFDDDMKGVEGVVDMSNRAVKNIGVPKLVIPYVPPPSYESAKMLLNCWTSGVLFGSSLL